VGSRRNRSWSPDLRRGATDRGSSPAPMDVDVPDSGLSLLARLTLTGEGSSMPRENERRDETLFRRLGVSLEERLGLTGDASGTLPVKKRRGRPPKAIRERRDERRDAFGC
jgi:hypothetical protein